MPRQRTVSPMRLLGTTARAIAWNAMLGAVTGLATGIVVAVMGEASDVAAIVAVLALGYGLLLGVAAGVVHAVAQLPLHLLEPSRAGRAVRLLATAVSAALVGWLLAIGFEAATTFVVFGPYVLLTPWFAAWGYVDASTEAADSAALRRGASTVSRVSGSASDSSTATSE